MGIIVVCRSLTVQCLLRFDRGLYQFKDLLAIYHENSSFFSRFASEGCECPVVTT